MKENYINGYLNIESNNNLTMNLLFLLNVILSSILNNGTVSA